MMRMQGPAWLAVFALAAVALAGCSDDGGGDEPATTGQPELEEGKGAIEGLVLDDRLRPIPSALLLLQPAGLTNTTTINGEFRFVDLEPGTYTLRVDAEGHEAASQTVQVEEDLFTEVSITARRVVNEGGVMLSQEYSVFIPCSFALAGAYGTYGCADTSGESYRPGVRSINFTGQDALTWLVTEMKTQREGQYLLSVRHDDGTPLGGERYAAGSTAGGDYVKVIMQVGAAYQEGTAQWQNDKPLAALVFFEGFDDTTQTGVSYADEGQIIMTLFIGEPEEDPESFCVICE